MVYIAAAIVILLIVFAFVVLYAVTVVSGKHAQPEETPTDVHASD